MNKGYFTKIIFLLIVFSILTNVIVINQSHKMSLSIEMNNKSNLDIDSIWKSVEHQFSRYDTDFIDVKFWNLTHGWIVGNNDTNLLKGDCFILNTVNGGDDWSLQYFNNSERFESIEIIDQDTIWVGGREGLFYTQNGGNDWYFKKIEGIGGYFRSIYFYNNTLGWTTGISLYKTRDGGEHWEEVLGWDLYNQSSPEFTRDIKFISLTEGWVITTRGIYHTNDTGVTWTQQFNKGGWIIHPIDSDLLWVAQDTSLRHSSNGGDSWKTITFYSNYYFTDIEFTDENNGWAVGAYPFVSYTPDGGKNWYEQEIGTELSIRAYSCYFFNESIGWIVGGHGSIFKSTNATYYNTDNIRNQQNFTSSIEFFPIISPIIVLSVISVLKRKRNKN